MRTFGVVGPSRQRRRAVERIAGALEEGRVGVVRAGDSVERDELPPGASVACRVDGDGGWTATSERGGLADVLDDLAPRCSHAIVEGRPGADLPQVVIGDDDVAGRELARAPEAAKIDLAGLREAIADLEPRETLESLVEAVKRSPDEIYSGAIATFTGRVRAKEGPEDDHTEYLEFERYDDVVADRMAEIRSTLESRDGVYEVRLHHRTGVMEAGEDIVFVVVLAGHRAEAFEAVEDGIDRLKEVVPLFKKEVTVEDEFWVHEDR